MNKLSYFSKPNEDNLEGSKELNQIWQRIAKLRYDVFAEELQQYPINSEKQLDTLHNLTYTGKTPVVSLVTSYK